MTLNCHANKLQRETAKPAGHSRARDQILSLRHPVELGSRFDDWGSMRAGRVGQTSILLFGDVGESKFREDAPTGNAAGKKPAAFRGPMGLLGFDAVSSLSVAAFGRNH